MTINEIENYLSIKNTALDQVVGDEIEKLRICAIRKQNEESANYCWCLQQIFKIQNEFIKTFNCLKNQEYEDAWCAFEQIDIAIGFLESNFDINQPNDKYHIFFIKRILKDYQKLFPYVHFFSRENIIKAEKCSICGQPLSFRHPCGHKVGKLYMGELCLRKITDFEFKAVSLVTDPFDKYTYVQIPDKEYNYGMLELLMSHINTPYDDFYVETVKILNPEYEHVGPNQPCPCGSGKKYKKCHFKTKDELIDHHIIKFNKLGNPKERFMGTFSTWK